MLDERFRQLIKTESENQILKHDWGICAWLTPIGEPNIREVDEIADRLLVMNALLQINLGMPLEKILAWLKRYDKLNAISDKEKMLLRRIHKSGLSELTRSFFSSYADNIWAFLWALCVIEDFSALTPPIDIQQYLPDIDSNNPDTTVPENYRYIRPIGDLYAMLDFYYRLHWYCVDQATSNKENSAPPENRIYHRRKALQWVYDKNSSWDEALPSF